MLGQHTEFYPSTQPIANRIVKICEDYRYKNGRSSKSSFRIIDPSAGNGVLLDAIRTSWCLGCKQKDSRTGASSTISAIEIDPELRHILAGKGYTVIDFDWLQYREPTNFDIITMNPPFSDGIHHILKAWEYLADDGLLVSVVPDTMLDEGNSYKQRLSALIAQFGTVESIGQAFLDGAMRKTGVECSIVTLIKPKAVSKNWFADLKLEEESFDLGEDFCANPLAHPNQIESLVRQYQIVCQCAIERDRAQQKLNYFLRGISSPVYQSTDRYNDANFTCTDNLDTQLRIIKSRFWNTLFTKTKIGTKTTSSFQRKFEEGALETTRLAFNKANILEVLSIFFDNRAEIMQDCIRDVFKRCTDYHEHNTIHCEGWKSNKTSKVAERIIIPNANLFDKFGWKWIYSGERFGTFGDDFDKVLCWITGINPEDPRFNSLIATINKRLEMLRKASWDTSVNIDYTEELTSTFFRIKLHKKGTIHLRFIDDNVRDAFNKAAAKGTKVIGADY